MRKKFTSVFFSFIFAFAVISSSYISTYNVYASNPLTNLADKLTYFFLTTTGAVDAGINGVAQVSNNLYNSVREKINNLIGNGIYEDGSGNIVFNEAASQELYETLLSSPDINARVISYFPNTSPYVGLYGTDSAFFHPDVRSFGNTGRSLYDNYLAVVGFDSSYDSKIAFFDLSNVAYLVCSNTQYPTNAFTLRFYNVSGQLQTVSCSIKYGSYSSGNGGSFSSVSSASRNTNSFTIYNNENYVGNNNDYYNDIYFNSIGVGNINYTYSYSNFPYISGNGSLCWSNRSIICSINSAYGLQEVTKQDGVFIVNTYNVIPSVSTTVIQNNNWQKIYNDYTQNVNNESDTYISNDTLDSDALRKVMKKYTKVITDAIEDGTQDIENAISTTNEWLKKIYERLGEISAKLDNIDGGDSSGGDGSGCVWTEEDITAIKNALNRIDSNMALELAESQKIYTFLGQILTAINNINVDGGRDITTIIPIITNLPDSDVLDFIDSGDVLADLMSSVVPFCFVGFALGLTETLSSEPVTPRWVIPLRLNSATTGLNVNEELVIDFSEYEQSGFGFIHDLLIAGQCILFILALIWLTFNLLESFNIIFG